MKSEDESEGVIHFANGRSDGNISVDPNSCRMGTAGQTEDGNTDPELAHSGTYSLQIARSHSKIPDRCGVLESQSMSFSFDLSNRNYRAARMFIALLSLELLNGCGGGWQPDPRDLPQSPARSGVEGSGLNGPLTEDSRTHL